MRKNESCFLQDRCWEDLLDSSIIPTGESFFERSAIGLGSVKLVSRLSGHLVDVSSFVCHGHCSTYGSDRITLVESIRQFREILSLQLSTAQQLCAGGVIHSDLRYELLATSLMVLATVNRMLSALGDAQGAALEAEALRLVKEMQRLEADLVAARGWVSLAMSLKARAVESIPRTAELWAVVPGKVIERWRFHAWCRVMQREHCRCGEKG